MTNLLRPMLPVLLAVTLVTGSAAAWARPPSVPMSMPPQGGQAQGRHDQGRDDSSLSDSVRRVERSTRGQVLSAEPVPFDGRSINRIKVVDDRGRVRVYMDDPQSRQQQDQPDSPAHPPARGPTRDDDD